MDNVTIPSSDALFGAMTDTAHLADLVRKTHEQAARAAPEDETAAAACEESAWISRTLEAGMDNMARALGRDPRKEQQDTRIYTGERQRDGTTRVTAAEDAVRSPARELDPRLDIRNHSPTGLEWGYQGSGPAQLALAILADLTGDDAYANCEHQRFKADVTSRIRGDRWTIMGEDAMGWVRDHPADPDRLEWIKAELETDSERGARLRSGPGQEGQAGTAGGKRGREE
jgi:hypothetical protein